MLKVSILRLSSILIFDFRTFPNSVVFFCFLFYCENEIILSKVVFRLITPTVIFMDKLKRIAYQT
jgi:hypothetical protein